MNRILFASSLAVLAVTSSAFAQTRTQTRVVVTGPSAKGPSLSTYSQTNPDGEITIRAMRDEMKRAQKLKGNGALESPYLISYGIMDTETYHVVASLGSLIQATRFKGRVPNIEVRVGSYDLDHTGHVFTGNYTGTGYNEAWPLDDNYAALRSSLWLSTDRSYKTAVESMSRKRATMLTAIQTKDDHLPSYWRANPVTRIDKVSHPEVRDEEWNRRMTNVSSVFKTYPEVVKSVVDFRIIQGTSVLLNSEGTTVRYADNLNWLTSKAEGFAPDGMLVHDGLAVPTFDLDKFPTDDPLRRDMTQIAENVRALVKAPAGEGYSGPVLFEPWAAAQLLAQLLGDNFEVPRRPLTDPGRNIPFLPSEFENKLGARILPEWIDVVDDPHATEWNGQPLIGFYPFDLEGIPPVTTTLVEKGVLKNFLTTRQPVKGMAENNGHARLYGQYGTRTAAIGNMFVKANQTSSLAELKSRLIEEIRRRNKPYGMLVRKLDFPTTAGVTELQQLAADNQQVVATKPVSPPVMVYKVYADGREELVRNLRFRGLNSRALQGILGASSEQVRFDFVNNGALFDFPAAGGYLALTSVVSPGILLDEVEFERQPEIANSMPIVPAPALD